MRENKANNGDDGCPWGVASTLVSYVLLVCLPTNTALAEQFLATWIGPTGNWNDATKWNTTDYPHNNGDTYDVLINIGTVTASGSITIDILTLSDPSMAGVKIDGSGVLSVLGTFTWSGGTLEGVNEIHAKDLDLSGNLTLAGGSSLDYTGLATMAGDNSLLNISSGKVFRNRAGAQFLFAGDGDFTSNASFDNAGLLIKQAGGNDGVTEIGHNLIQNGALDVQSGTLRLVNSSTHHGTTHIGSGGMLELRNFSHEFDTGSPVDGDGILRVTDTSLHLPTAALDMGAQLELIGGSVTGSGTLNANGRIIWSGGYMSGSGITNFNASPNETILSGDLNVNDTRVLNLDNDAKYQGNGTRIVVNSIAELNNRVGRQFTLAGDSDIIGGSFHNHGRLIKQSGGGDGITEIWGNFNNEAAGIVEVQSGARLQLHTASTHHGLFEGPGTLDFGAYSTQRLEVDSRVEVAHVEFHSIVDIDGAYEDVGSTIIERGEARFNAVAFTDSLTLTGGLLGGTGSLTAFGATTWNDGTMGGDGTFHPQGGMLLSGNLTLADMRTINNTGTASYSGDGALSSSASAEFNNQATGSLQLLGDADYLGGTINNQGQIAKLGGTGVSEITATLNNLGTGLVEVRSGTLKLKDGAHSGQFVRYVGSTMEFTGNSTHDASDIVVFDPNPLIRGGDDTGATLFTEGVTLLDDGTQISGPGFARVAGGTVNVGDEIADVVTAENFAVDDGALGGSGMLEVNGQFQFTGGTMGGDGITHLNMTAELSGDPILAGARTVNNDGDVTYRGDGGRLTQEFGSLPVFNNRGSFTFTGDSDYVASIFNNSGTLIKQAGGEDGHSSMSTVNNSGSVQVQSGTLSLSASGVHTGNFSGGGTLELGGPHLLQTGSSVTVSTARHNGTIDIDGTYNVPHTEVASGAANFNVTAATQSLDITGGRVSGSGTLNVSGTTNWTSGGMGGSGVTNAMGPVNISGFVSLDGTRTLNNFALATYAGDSGRFWNLPGTSTFHNQSGAQLTFAGDSDYYNGTIQNDGTLVKQAGASNGKTLIDATLNNAGTVNVQSGTLALNKGGTLSGQFLGAGILEFSGGTNTLQLTSQVAVDNVLLSGGTTFLGGAYDVSDTTITAYDHHFNGSAQTDVLHLAGGTLHGNGALTVTGMTYWTSGWMRGGGVTNAQGGILVTGWGFLEDTRTLNSAGLTEVQGDYGGFWNGGNTTFSNLPTAELRFVGDSDYLFGTLDNQGLLVKQAGASDGVTEISAAVNNTGAIEVQSGSLNLTGPFTQTAGSLMVATGAGLTSASQLNVQGGVLAAGHGVTIDANVSLDGVLQVGGSTGVVTLDGNYSQGFPGTLEVEVGGRDPGQFDQLNITGSATLRGTLEVSLVGTGGDPFAPIEGDVFEILTAGTSMIGMFGNPPVLPPLSSGLAWNINYDVPNRRVLLEVLASALAGDFDGDVDVDGVDFLVWQRGELPNPLSLSDLIAWQTHFGTIAGPIPDASTAVPEPMAGLLLILGMVALLFRGSAGPDERANR